jgi:hypothetical protein
LNAGSARKKIQIVSVLVTARDGVDARPNHVRARMKDTRRIATVGKASRQPIGDAKAALSHRKQHHTAIRSEAPAIESGCDFPGPNGWKRKRQQSIVGHGQRGVGEMEKRVGVSNQILF